MNILIIEDDLEMAHTIKDELMSDKVLQIVFHGVVMLPDLSSKNTKSKGCFCEGNMFLE